MKRFYMRFLLFAFVFSALSGCMKTDTSNCAREYTLTVRAYGVFDSIDEIDELTTDDVEEVWLYVFDHRQNFVERIATHVGESITITSPMGKDLHFVAWGNTEYGAGQMAPELSVGDHISLCQVHIAKHTRSTLVVTHAIDDIFSGVTKLGAANVQGNNVLPIYRRVGSMHITGLGFDTSADYEVTVGTTPSTLGHDGVNSGDDVHYLPFGEFILQRYIVAIFNKVPGENITVEIVKNGGEQRFVVTKDINNEPIRVVAGMLTQVVLNLSGGELYVTVELRPWNSLSIIKDF